MDFASIWYVLIVVLFAGYVVLDGFDLGVGILHLFTKDETAKRINLTAIGPVWDGNEVWLVTAGGALFAAFPPVYATLTSGAYLAVTLFLFALILRAVSIEFRGRVNSPAWKETWDSAFGVGSFLAALLLGVAIGNLITGFPLAVNGSFHGSLLGLVRAETLAIGVAVVLMLVLHGALYLCTKTTESVYERIHKAVAPLWVVTIIALLAALVVSYSRSPLLVSNLSGSLAAVLVLGMAAVAFINIVLAAGKNRDGWAFLSSILAIILGMTGLALAQYPGMLLSHLDPAASLSALHSSSTELTLRIMFLIAAIGMPLVLVYTGFVYWAFRGRIKQPSDHY